MKAKRIPVLILCGALMLASAGCSTQETIPVNKASYHEENTFAYTASTICKEKQNA
ncbi:MAG: hypothetical protein IKG30_08770 [Clostridiales bacterium]|nr:hypothetical protein [Clostridiales bacterium]